MDVAVGRLQFSVKFADTRSMSVEEPTQPQADPVEAAFRRERSYRDLAADRERWASSTLSRGGISR
jgi:hypothetical protein